MGMFLECRNQILYGLFVNFQYEGKADWLLLHYQNMSRQYKDFPN